MRWQRRGLGRTHMSHVHRRFVAAGADGLTGLAGLTLVPSSAQGARSHLNVRAAHQTNGGRYNVKTATSKGFGGAVTSVDPGASRVGLRVLRRGGNAVDAAVATAAALGVTEPYSSGIGGGGYFVHYDARSHSVRTVDGRETAPASFTDTVFTDGSGNAMDFPTVVSSG